MTSQAKEYSRSAVKRIMTEYHYLMKNSDKIWKEDKILFHFNEEEVGHLKVMLVGAEGTPYENGFYFFTVDYPKDYPNTPPLLGFVNSNRWNTRFNPNLYVSHYVNKPVRGGAGKVCLSILDTWSGKAEGWAPSITIHSVLVTLQGSVLNETPLINEPGFEAIDERHGRYNEVVGYANFETSVLNVLKRPPDGFSYFYTMMKEYFSSHYDDYMKRVKECQKKFDKMKVFTCSYQGQHIPNGYKEIEKGLREIMISLKGTGVAGAGADVKKKQCGFTLTCGRQCKKPAKKGEKFCGMHIKHKPPTT